MTPHGTLHDLRVLHFGHFDPAYSRNRIVAKALRRAGADVRTVTDPRPYLQRTPGLIRTGRREPFDVVLVGFPGFADVPVAKLLAIPRRVPVVFDAFVSLQETADDRGDAGGVVRRRLAIEDRLAFRLADAILVDTEEHGRHFTRDIGADVTKLHRLWVGADDDVMRPQPVVPHDDFRVFVYASFIPLHGLEHVVRAAALLEARGEAVVVDVVGSGETEASIRSLAQRLQVRSVNFLGRRPYDALPAMIAASDLCLGIFGTSPKAQRVIPNKVFDALACGRAVVTADTPAARELLHPGGDAWLCEAGSPEAIADAVSTLREDDHLRVAIAERGHARFRESAGIDALAHRLAGIMHEVRRTPAA